MMECCGLEYHPETIRLVPFADYDEAWDKCGCCGDFCISDELMTN